MINSSINYLRKYHKFKWDYDLEEAEEIPYDQQLAYDTNIVMNCIQELPAGYRVVLNMYAIEGYSHKEIAAQLKIQESTSRSQYLKAKNALLKILNNKGIYYEKKGS
jgi:RNA polymerase sigma-70 factor (ECF subfamily)